MYQVHRRQVLNECRPAPAMVVEGKHVETKAGPRSSGTPFLFIIIITLDCLCDALPCILKK